MLHFTRKYYCAGNGSYFNNRPPATYVFHCIRCNLGPFTGAPGYKKAADYTADVFRKAGLNPGYTNEKGEKSFFQPVPFIRNDYASSSITIRKNGMKSTFMHSAGNFVILNRGLKYENIPIASPMFIGYGIIEPEKVWDDYAGLDVEGKWAIIQNGIPPAGSDPFFLL
jgi:hypothetical protein